jgi:hypothetical protein
MLINQAFVPYPPPQRSVIYDTIISLSSMSTVKSIQVVEAPKVNMGHSFKGSSILNLIIIDKRKMKMPEKKYSK